MTKVQTQVCNLISVTLVILLYIINQSEDEAYGMSARPLHWDSSSLRYILTTDRNTRLCHTQNRYTLKQAQVNVSHSNPLHTETYTGKHVTLKPATH